LFGRGMDIRVAVGEPAAGASADNHGGAIQRARTVPRSVYDSAL
jgi:hypothetical protein